MSVYPLSSIGNLSIPLCCHCCTKCPCFVSLSFLFLPDVSWVFFFFFSSRLLIHLTRRATSLTLLFGKFADILIYLPSGVYLSAGNFLTAASNCCCSSSV